MQIGIVGLGRMGGNMARRLARRKVTVIGFDRSAKQASFRDEAGITATDSLDSSCWSEVAARRVADVARRRAERRSDERSRGP